MKKVPPEEKVGGVGGKAPDTRVGVSSIGKVPLMILFLRMTVKLLHESHHYFPAGYPSDGSIS